MERWCRLYVDGHAKPVNPFRKYILGFPSFSTHQRSLATAVAAPAINMLAPIVAELRRAPLLLQLL